MKSPQNVTLRITKTMKHIALITKWVRELLLIHTFSLRRSSHPKTYLSGPRSISPYQPPRRSLAFSQKGFSTRLLLDNRPGQITLAHELRHTMRHFSQSIACLRVHQVLNSVHSEGLVQPTRDATVKNFVVTSRIRTNKGERGQKSN